MKLRYKDVVYWVQKGFCYTEIGNRLMKHPSTIRNMVVSDSYLRERYQKARLEERLIKEAQKQQLKIKL